MVSQGPSRPDRPCQKGRCRAAVNLIADEGQAKNWPYDGLTGTDGSDG